MAKKYEIIYIFILMFFFSGCSMLFSNKEPKQIDNFHMYDFYGRWYEIGKINNDDELKNIVYVYYLDNNGYVKVNKLDRDIKNEKIKLKNAKVVFDKNSFKFKTICDDKTQINYVAKMNDNFQYVLIFGNNKNKIWLLSKTKTMPEVIKKYILEL